MPRIPYVPQDLHEPAEVVNAIRARRGGQLEYLDRMLLHSPPFALGWNVMLGAVRTQLTLVPKLRELAICAVGAINKAAYELDQHAAPFLQSGGTAAQFQALRDCDRAADDPVLFNDAERATLRLALAMSRDVQVSTAVFQAARAALGSDQQLVELIGVIASYNMVSRFLVALGIEP